MFKIEYARGVAKDLKSLPKEIQKKAFEAIEKVLAEDPFAGKPLAGEFKGLWKFRIGDYRVVYTVEKARLVILVLRIRHRKEVYR